MRYLMIFTAIAGLLSFSSCSKTGSGQVEVRFVNSTGNDLKDITVNSLPIGDISKDATSEFHAINGFGSDTGMPDANFAANIEGRRLNSTSQFFWCGTEKSRLEPGEYTVEVKLTTMGGQQYFQLSFQ